MSIDDKIKKPVHKKSNVNSNWFKNVGRSLGMTSTELLTDLMPSTIELVSNNAETVSETIKDIRENKGQLGRLSGNLGITERYQMTMEGLKNAMEDISTGNIYNKDRIDKLYDDGEDFGLEDFDFDDSSDSFSSDDSDVEVSKARSGVKVVAPVISDNRDVVNSINAQSQVILNSASATIEASSSMNANAMLMSQRHTQVMSNALGSINNNLETMVNFYSTNMTKYIQASVGYYEQSLQHLSDTVAELRKVSEFNTRASTDERKELKNQWNDVLLSQGGLDVGNYINTVSKNLKVAAEEDLILSSLMNFWNDKDTLKYMIASPISGIARKIVQTAMPAMLQSSLAALDETMSNFFPSLLLKITGLGDRSNGNYFMDLISKVFGIRMDKKNEIDRSAYNKDSMSYNGLAQKAITEVIPSYLKQMTAALTGLEERSFDYEKGVFRKTTDMQKDFESEREKKARSGYGEIISEVKTRSKAYEFGDKDVEAMFQEGIDKFFSQLGKSGKFLNPVKDNQEFYNEIYDFKGDKNLQKLFRNIMQSLDRKQMMALSKATIDSRSALSKYYDELEQNQELAYQSMLSNGMPIDEMLQKDKKGNVIGVSKSSPFYQTDKYNLSALDYLRRIEGILTEGIRVFPQYTNYKGKKGTPTEFSYDKRQKSEEMAYTAKEQKENQSKIKTYSEKDQQNATKKGVTILDNSFDLGEDEQIRSDIEMYLQLNRSDEDEKDNQKDSLMKKLGNALPKDSQGKWGDFTDMIHNVMSAPGRILAGVVDKLDKTLFNVVFGVNDSEGNSFVNAMISTFNTKMNNVVTWFGEKIFDPLHETLFGENGWFTRFKESEFFNTMKGKFNLGVDYLFGGIGKDGFRSGGLFSDAFNQFKDVFKGFGHYFTGKSYVNSKGETVPDNPNSVFNNIKDIAKDAYESTKAYVFGGSKDENGNPDADKPITTIIKESMITGATNFHKAIFGDDDSTLEEHKQIVTELTGKLKDSAPKALAWGAIGAGAATVAGASGLGLMGSLFLPGGPIGGAILGSSLAFLSNSDKFMDKVFGAKDQNDERIGGLISKSTQDFFKENKNIIVGAGILGALKPSIGLGILPSWVLPGGPIGGALFGVATALAVRSNTFQELMFGKETADGDKAGGILSSFSNKMKDVFGDKSAKEVMGNVGVGALGGAALSAVVGQMGIMGAMLTPGGPIGGALLGAAAGIALSSDKWRKAIFGEIDEETGKREGGVLGKMGYWMEYNVLNPMKDTFDDVKLNVYEWFGNSIAFPFREALYPIKTEIHYMIEQVNEMFAKGWGIIQNGISNTLGKYVIKPFGEFMETHVMKPIRKMLGLGLKASLAAIKTAVAAPFKVMGVAGTLAERNQERRGKKAYVRDLKEAKSNGEIGGLEYLYRRHLDRGAMKDAKAAAKVAGNVSAMREEAAEAGVTLAEHIKNKKKDARTNYYAGLQEKFNNGEMSWSDYINARYFDRRGRDKAEDEALGTSGRSEYYEKLDADKAAFREKVNQEKDKQAANKSRRKYLRELGMDTGYTGFIYEKDADGNTIANGTKVSVERVTEALAMKRSEMSKEQEQIFAQIGERLGISNLLDAYGEGGLNMKDLGRKNRNRLKDGITSGSVNDLLRGLSPYTLKDREEAFNEELVNLTKEYSEKMSQKVDTSNSTLAELENTFKDAYNLLRVKFGLKTVKFTKNKDARSMGTTTSVQLALPSPEDSTEKITDKLDEVTGAIISTNTSSEVLALPAPKPEDETNNMPLLPAPKTDDSETVAKTAKMTADTIVSATEKLKARELFEEKEKEKEEEIEKNQEHASRKTASFVIAENEKKKGVISLFKNNFMQTELLDSINNIMGKFSKSFDWVFGKKGLLTGLFLIALPLILKWLKGLMGGNNENRLGAGGEYITNTGVNGALGTGLAKGLGELSRRLLSSDVFPKITEGIAKRWDKFIEGMKIGEAKQLAKAAASLSEEALEKMPYTKLLKDLDYTKALPGGAALKGLPVPKVDIKTDMLPAPLREMELNAATIRQLTGLDNVDDYAELSFINSSGDEVLIKNMDHPANKVFQQEKTGDIIEGVFTERNYKNTADEVASKGGNWFDNLLKKFTKKSTPTSSMANDVVSGVGNAMSSSQMDDIIKGARETGAGKVLTMIKEALASFISSVAKFVKAPLDGYKLAGELMSHVTTASVMAKFGSIIGNGAKLTLEAMATVFADKYMMMYGAATGAFEASRLFLVYNNMVDPTMAAISMAFKALMNWKHMWLVELANELIADATDIDIFNIIATQIYKAISDDEADFKLEMAQLDFKEGLEIYNDVHETNISLDAYNDAVNKTVLQDLMDSTSATRHNVEKSVGSVAKVYARSMLKTLGEEGVEGVTARFAKHKGIVSKTVDKLPFAKTLRNTASSITEGTTSLVGSISDIINKADEKLLTKFKTNLSTAITRLTEALAKKFPKMSSKLGGLVTKVMGKLSDKVLAKFIPQISKVMTKLAAAGTGVGIPLAVIWEAFDIVSGAVGGLTKTGAANIFMVDDSVVDWKMRGIAAVFQACLNTTVGIFIEILDLIWSEIANTSFITDFAGLVYDLISSEEDSQKLDMAQLALEEETTEYNQREGKSLSVSEYNDTVKNVGFFEKIRQKFDEKKNQKQLKREADALGITVEQLQERKEKRVKIDQGEVADVSQIVNATNSLEQQKEAIIQSTDENMYNLRKLLTATGEGLNTLTYEHMVEEFNLREQMSQKQLDSLRDTVTLFNDEFDANTKRDIAESLGVTTDALDGIVGTVEASVVGLNQTTIDKMMPIIGVSEEKLDGVRMVVEEALNGFDETSARMMLDAGEITQEQYDGIVTIIDATLSGMNEETLDKMAPLLGISSENLQAVKDVINGTMSAINDTSEYEMEELQEATEEALLNSKIALVEGMELVEEESGNWFTNMGDAIANWWNNSEIGSAVNAGLSNIKKAWNESEFGKSVNHGVSWIGDKFGIGDKKDEDRVTTTLGQDFQWLGGQIKDGWNSTGFGKSVNHGVSWIGDKFGIGDKKDEDRVTTTLGQDFQWLGGQIKDGVKATGSGIKTGAKWLGSKLGFMTSETKTTTNLAEDAKWLGGKVKDGASWLGGKLGITSGQEGVDQTTFLEDAKKLGQTVLDSISSSISSAWDGLKGKIEEKFSPVLEKITGAWDTVKQWTTDTFSPIIEKITGAWDSVKDKVSEKLAPFADYIAEKWGEVQEIWSGVEENWGEFTENCGVIWEAVKITASQKWEELKQNVVDTWDGFTEYAGQLWSGIKESVGGAWDSAKTSVEEVWSNVSSWANEKWTNVKTSVSTAWDNAKSSAEEVWSDVTSWANEKWTNVKTSVSTAWDNAKSSAEEVWSDVTSWANEKWTNVKTSVSTAWDDTKTAAEGVWSGFSTAASEKWTEIKDGILKAVEPIIEFADKYIATPLKSGIKTIFKNIVDGFLAPFKFIGNLFSKGLDAVNSGISGIVGWARNVVNNLGGKGGEDEDINLSTLGSQGKKLYNAAAANVNNVTNNIYNNYAAYSQGGFGEGPETQYSPGAKIIPMGGGKPVPVSRSKSVNQSGIGEGGKGVEPDTINNFAYYSQMDDRYKNHNYDLSPGLGHDSTPQLSARGCGPTSMAMVATQLTGKKYLPTTLADMSRQWGHSVSAGTSWAFYDKAAKEFSMDSSQKAASVTGMRSAINSGQAIIISGRRTTYGSNDSPFTTGGHFVVGVGTAGNSKILINDPRGSKYSKEYDINKVANEARQFWTFKYNGGGTLPNPDGDYNPGNNANNNEGSVNAATSEEKDLGTWGALSEMTRLISIYAGNLINGTNDRYVFNEKGTSNSSGSSSSGSSNGSGVASSIIPTNVEEAIAKKTLEMTILHETGGNYTRVVNDKRGSGETISPSIGIIQMRGNNARQLMKDMYAKLPNSSEARYWAEWNWDNEAPWSQSQRQRLENYLSSNLSVTKEVQDAHAVKYVRERNLSQVYEYAVNPGKFKDPRAIVHLGEIGNTGPANIKKLMAVYNKGNGSKDEFDHYISEFNAKSYWGKHMKTYKRRLDESYNMLKNWDPNKDLGGYGEHLPANVILGGFGEKDYTSMLNDLAKGAQEEAMTSVNTLVPGCIGNSCAGELGGFGENDSYDPYKSRTSDQVTSDRAGKMVETLFKDYKSRNFGTPKNVIQGNFGKTKSTGALFDPDLSTIENMGGKGGEDGTEPVEDSRTTPVKSNIPDKSAEELKKINGNVKRVADKFISSNTPKPLSEDRRVILQTATNQPNMDVLILEIIEILTKMNLNSEAINKVVTAISNKELSIDINNDISIEFDEAGNPIVVSKGGNVNNVTPMFNTNTSTETNVKYENAKKIAGGRIK